MKQRIYTSEGDAVGEYEKKDSNKIEELTSDTIRNNKGNAFYDKLNKTIRKVNEHQELLEKLILVNRLTRENKDIDDVLKSGHYIAKLESQPEEKKECSHQWLAYVWIEESFVGESAELVRRDDAGLPMKRCYVLCKLICGKCGEKKDV